MIPKSKSKYYLDKHPSSGSDICTEIAKVTGIPKEFINAAWYVSSVE